MLANSLIIKQKGESQNGCYKKIAHQIFRETNISYCLIHTPLSAYQGLRNVFQKIWRALFSCSSRFEIRLFALLPMNSEPIGAFNIELFAKIFNFQKPFTVFTKRSI